MSYYVLNINTRHVLSRSRTLTTDLTQWIAIVPAFNETNSGLESTLDFSSDTKSDLVECKPARLQHLYMPYSHSTSQTSLPVHPKKQVITVMSLSY